MSVNNKVASIRSGSATGRVPGQELLGHGHHRVLVAEEGQMIIAGQLDQPGPGDALGHVAAGVHIDELVAGPVEQQGGHPDGAQQPANVHRTQRHDRVVALGRRHGRQVEHPPPLAKRRVSHLAGRQPQHHLGGVERTVSQAG
jgi:hypothetical protein